MFDNCVKVNVVASIRLLSGEIVAYNFATPLTVRVEVFHCDHAAAYNARIRHQAEMGLINAIRAGTGIISVESLKHRQDWVVHIESVDIIKKEECAA